MTTDTQNSPKDTEEDLLPSHTFPYFTLMLADQKDSNFSHGQVAQLVGLSCTPKGSGFDSHSGHIPRLQVQSPSGNVQEATN